MSMGSPGDHPITDLIYWERNQFPSDIAEMIRALHSLDPKILNAFAVDSFAWAEGRGLEEGRAKLKAEIHKRQLN